MRVMGNMDHMRLPVVLLLVVGGVSCSFKPLSHKELRLRIGLPERNAVSGLFAHAPPDATMITCYAVNIFGPGIAPFNSGGYFSPETPAGMSSGCKYPGITSELLSADQHEVVLQVPVGPTRTIQVIEIHPPPEIGCPAGVAFGDFITWHDPRWWSYPYGISEFGSTTVDLFEATSVAVYHDPGAGPKPPLGCAQPLNLIAGYYGETDNLYTDAVSGLPPSGLTQIPDANLDSMRNFDLAAQMSSGASTPNSFARMDFVFDASGVDLNRFHNVRVLADIATENWSDCTAATSTVGSGAYLKVYLPYIMNGANTGGWSSGTGGEGHMETSTATEGVGPYQAAMWADFFQQSYGPFIYVSLRSSGEVGVSATNCPLLRVNGVSLMMED